NVIQIVAGTLILLFSLLPLLWMGFLAFRVPNRVFEPIWESPTGFTFDNVIDVINSGFLKSVLNSFLAAFGASLIALILGTPAAFSLAKWKIRKKNFYSWFVMLLRMAPPIGFAITLFLFFVEVGLVDSLIGLIMAYLIITLPL